MRKRIFDIIEVSDSDSILGKLYDYIMIFVIFASLVPLAFKEETYLFSIIEKTALTIFIIDYILRLITADYKFGKKSIGSFLRYPFSAFAIIDLVSILPLFVLLNSGFKVVRLLRITRAFNVLRVFKALRYSKSLSLVRAIFKSQQKPLSAVAILAVVYIFISALIIFDVEPDAFPSFFDALYWATTSLTTLGYGDIVPKEPIGRVVSMVSSIVSIAVIALPAGIISAGYMKEIEKEKEKNK